MQEGYGGGEQTKATENEGQDGKQFSEFSSRKC